MEILCQNCGHAFDSPLSNVGKIEYTQCENIFRMEYGVKIPCPSCKEILKVLPDQSLFVGIPLKQFSRTNLETQCEPQQPQKQNIQNLVDAPQDSLIEHDDEVTTIRPYTTQRPERVWASQWYRSEKAQKYSLIASAFLFVVCTLTIIVKEKQPDSPIAQSPESAQIEKTLDTYYEKELGIDLNDMQESESMQGGLLDNEAQDSQIEEKMLDSIKDTKTDLRVLHLPPLRKVTSSYGVRLDPFTKKLAFHGGLDFRADEGSNVFAALSGTVEYAGRKGLYGNVVIIKHDKGYKTLYAHLQKPLVKKGDQVSRKDVIGLAGSTGRSTGPHLHFELHKRGKKLDPLQADLIPKD